MDMQRHANIDVYIRNNPYGTKYSSAKMWNVYLRDLFEMHKRIELTENPLVDKQIQQCEYINIYEM